MMPKILRSGLIVNTSALLKYSESFEGYQLRNYFVDQESNSGKTIDNYVNCIMGKDRNWASTFEVVCAIIIYRVRIISIDNMKGGFIISNTLQLIDACQISDDVILNSDKNMCVYCYMHKAPITLSVQVIWINYVAYIYSISHLAIGSRHQIYYSNRHNHNIVTINQFLSSHDYVNNCTNVSSLYSQIINSCQNVNIVNSNICSIKTKKENQWLTQKVLL